MNQLKNTALAFERAEREAVRYYSRGQPPCCPIDREQMKKLIGLALQETIAA